MKHHFDEPNQITITKKFIITHYTIGNIILCPNINAIIDVIFYDSSDTRYHRSFLLIDTEDKKDYTNWETDDYLYSYINSNFLRIFDN